jgi:hypothetical protein
MSDDAATGSRTPASAGPASAGPNAPERIVDGRGVEQSQDRSDGTPPGGSSRGEDRREPQDRRAQAAGQPDQPDQPGRQRPEAPGAGPGAPTTVLPGTGGRPARPAARADRAGDRSSPPRPAGERQAPARAGGERQPAPRPGGRRRARLAVQRLDPWSVFLFSLVASICLGVVLFVAVAALYAAMSSLGVLDSLNDVLGEVAGTGADAEVVNPVITPSLVLGATAVLAAINVVLLTALATLGALIYNLCASLTGGIEVQLGERD